MALKLGGGGVFARASLRWGGGVGTGPHRPFAPAILTFVALRMLAPSMLKLRRLRASPPERRLPVAGSNLPAVR
jgi:hypothetical protein